MWSPSTRSTGTVTRTFSASLGARVSIQSQTLSPAANTGTSPRSTSCLHPGALGQASPDLQGRPVAPTHHQERRSNNPRRLSCESTLAAVARHQQPVFAVLGPLTQESDWLCNEVDPQPRLHVTHVRVRSPKSAVYVPVSRTVRIGTSRPPSRPASPGSSGRAP